MLTAVILGPSFIEASAQIIKALPYADILEIRCSLKKEDLQELRNQFTLPMIFKFPHAEDFLDLHPEYIDIDYGNPLLEQILKQIRAQIDKKIRANIGAQIGSTKIILSHHDFEKTPDDLDGLYQKMCQHPAAFYKIAVMANSCLDAWRLISWSRRQDDKLIAISMGPHGEASRILAPFS
ncbi:MAG: type I 3-dehydroquinate dehydratase, partial [Chlamydiota bacterium]